MNHLDLWNQKKQQFDANLIKINGLHDYQQVLYSFDMVYKMWMHYRINESADKFPVNEEKKTMFKSVEFNSSMFDEVYPLLKESFDLLMQEENSSLRFIHSKNCDKVFLIEKFGGDFHGGFCNFNEAIKQMLMDILENDVDKSILIVGFARLEKI